MWADLKRFVKKRRCYFVDDLAKVIREFEKKLTPQYCQGYIQKLKKVMQIVIDRNWAWSDC